MAAPVGIPEVVAASADIHDAETDAVPAATGEIIEADGFGPASDPGLRSGRLAVSPPASGVQVADQVVATTTADPRHADAEVTPHPLDDTYEAAADRSVHEADAADNNPYLVHDDAAGPDIAQDDAAAPEATE